MSFQLSAKHWIYIIHLMCWLMLAFIMTMIFQKILGTSTAVILAVGINLLGFAVLIYGHLWVLLPKFYDHKKYLSYLLALLALIFITSFIRFWAGWQWSIHFDPNLQGQFTPQYFSVMVVGSLFLILITIPLRLIEEWFTKKELEQNLKTHQLEAELRFLKAQVNPHFLFNALNNIYSLSFTASKKAPEMILKLSDMMSYMLYDCKSDTVPLSAELNYLRNYIDLQQLKKEGQYKVDFEVEGEVAALTIVPMLFIPFFENAFKHGNIDDLSFGWIKSKLLVRDEVLEFTIANSIPSNSATRNQKKGGVGLQNIKSRLELIYPEQHSLQIEQKDRIYTAKLSLDLKPNL